MQIKVILVKLDIQLMSFRLHKVNQLECSKPKQETDFHLTQRYY